MSAATTYPGCWHAAVDFLRAAGTRTVFGLPADDLVLLAALQDSDLDTVLCRDQRNAVFMATGYAIASGKPGVCVVGKGPAVTNAVTGILEAACSAAPVVLLAAGTSSARRGAASFQELDQLPVVAPLVKWAHRVDHPDRVPAALQQAWAIATTGRPGPVYLELPDHLLTEPVERSLPWHTRLEVAARHRPDPTGPAVAAIRSARRPVLLVGGGCRHRNPDGVLERVATKLGAGVFTTASGRGAVDESHDLVLGLSGLYLRPAAEKLWHDADLVIALGSRLEETAVFGWDAPTVVQVNTEAADLSVEFAGHRVLADVADVAAALLEGDDGAVEPQWRDRVADAREQLFADAESVAGDGSAAVARLLSAMQETLPADRVLVQENGLQDMWSYLFPLVTCSPGGSVVPSEQTSLGFGAAAAGGVALAVPDRQVVAFVGDGAFAMADADLPTAQAAGTGVLFVVLCNGGYGWLQSQFDQRGLDGDRFAFADGGLPAMRPDPEVPSAVHQVVARRPDEYAEVLRDALRKCRDGRVSVVYVPVDLADVPPGLSEVEGDFPVLPNRHA